MAGSSRARMDADGGVEDAARPDEVFAYHNAGADGWGGSSYLDSVMVRLTDGNGDGLYEYQHFPFQNWHADVVAVIAWDGVSADRVRYSAYGAPTLLPAGDYNGDGVVNSADDAAFAADQANSDPRADLSPDETWDTADDDALASLKASAAYIGRGYLSNFGLRKGYAGYENDGVIARFDHVRHRVHHAVLGRWLTRDPAGYLAGRCLYEYTSSSPSTLNDPSGLDPPRPTGPWVPGKPLRRPDGREGWHPRPPDYSSYECDIHHCQDLRPNPNHTPSSNGCGSGPLNPLIPEKPFGIVSFTPCCDAHDLHYDTCSRNNRRGWDDEFCSCVHDRCDEETRGFGNFFCHILAGIYCIAVRSAGGFFYCDAQKNACICCDGAAAESDPRCVVVVGY